METSVSRIRVLVDISMSMKDDIVRHMWTWSLFDVMQKFW